MAFSVGGCSIDEAPENPAIPVAGCLARSGEPLSSASHVRSALSRFDQVTDVSDADRALAFENIRLAASYFDVGMSEKSWHELMHAPGH